MKVNFSSIPRRARILSSPRARLFVIAFGAFFLFFSLVVPLHGISAEGETAQISVFVRDDCRHCQDEKAFLAELIRSDSSVMVTYYDLSVPEHFSLFTAVTERYGLPKSTPLTLVRSVLIQGFGDAATTGKEIRTVIDGRRGANRSFAEALDGGVTIGGIGSACAEEGVCRSVPSFLVRLPVIGRVIDVGAFSLSALSLTLGLIDGFNPCAMWVLVMFLLILSQVGSRRRMVQYAGLFILAEAIMYYAILTVWYTAWDFVALDRVVTPLVGILAVGSGIYFLYKFATYTPVCTVAGPEKRQRISERVKALAAKPLTVGVVLGILGLAFSVNIFEFACSIGIPQAFTKILELNALSWLGRQLYMLLYILMYMVDDVIVFGIALYSFDKIGITSKYSKWSTLIGGILMFVLGAILLFKPSMLVF